jgi:nucleoside-diphosphate-sugar epimerase
MKVMITGAAGFIGGYLVKYCLRAGFAVVAMDNREPEEELTRANFQWCDVRDSGKANIRIPAGPNFSPCRTELSDRFAQPSA